MISDIEDVLRRKMGLVASSIGTMTVERVVRGRMARVGATTTEEYLSMLHHSPVELNELIEEVVIPESWFLRDVTPFAALAKWVREQWLPTHPGATLRVLTVPCSTGEEPYSVAMTLLDAGLAPERFAVDAVDISHRALAQAQRAVYGQNSFRGQDLDFRDRYFEAAREGYALSAAVRRQVRFSAGNILADGFRPGAGRFDVIFCRNLLIYFDRPTQAQAVRALAGMLLADGLLFVGHAETGIAAAVGFTATPYPMSFSFRKAAAPAPSGSGTKPPQTAVLRSRGGTGPSPQASAPSTARFGGIEPKAAQSVSPHGAQPLAPKASSAFPIPATPLPKKSTALEAARALADQGKLEEASRLCEDHLKQDGASAAAWYLLGVMRDAAGDRRRAAECYSKTLYLEPDHQEALLQRALLAEQSGDCTAAAQLRRRIARVQGRSVRG